MVRFAPQSHASTVDYVNQGTGSNRTVNLTLNAEVQETHTNNFGCNLTFGKEGKGTGTLTQGLTVHGAY